MARLRQRRPLRHAGLLVCLGLLAVTGCTGGDGGPSRPRQATANPTNLAARSNGVLERLLQSEEPGCSAAVGREGAVAWAGARGAADLRTGAALTPRSVFDIASVSKQFTAVAVLLLAERRRLELTDPVGAHLDGLPPWSREVTIDQLVHHTSGIPDYTGLLLTDGFSLADRTTQAQAIRAIARTADLSAEPGARFEYSNSNYVLLAEVVRTVSSRSLPDFLASELFQPLGLDMAMDPLGRGPRAAVPYERGAGKSGWQVAGSGWEQVGDGSIRTTPSELVRWADTYRTGAVGGVGLLRRQTERSVPIAAGAGRYGAGIVVAPDGTLSHDGAWGGFVTLFGIAADRRTSIAVSCNAASADVTGVAEGLRQIWS